MVEARLMGINEWLESQLSEDKTVSEVRTTLKCLNRRWRINMGCEECLLEDMQQKCLDKINELLHRN